VLGQVNGHLDRAGAFAAGVPPLQAAQAEPPKSPGRRAGSGAMLPFLMVDV
jgi:hypothetical protein